MTTKRISRISAALGCLIVHTAHAWAPPRSFFEPNGRRDWEPVQAMRERLGVSYNYTPSLLHPEVCRYVSEQECALADRGLQRHAQSHRKLRGENPNLGKIKVLVLLVQFTDHKTDRVLTKKSYIEDLWNLQIKNWFSENSQGAYEIEPYIMDWTLTDNTEKYYSFDAMGFVPDLQKALWPSLNKLDNTPGWDWSLYDSDGNGELDAVVMMHSGIDAVVYGPDCFGRETINRIFPHAYSSSVNAWTSKDGNVTLNGYAINSVYDDDCDDKPATPGLACHEFMHTMGLIDLYDETDLFEAKGVGAWDIMSNPYGHKNNGTPGFLGAWSRQEAGWVSPTEIEYNGIYTLQPSETSNQTYRITLQANPVAPEYLLIENRQKISWDQNLWDAGLVIYHIDDGADGMKYKGFPGQIDDQGLPWPTNGNHYRVAVLPKDGKYDLENNKNSGDAGDMWLPGDVLGPGMGNTVFPNTDSYQVWGIEENGISITVLEQLDNQDVTFEVSGLGANPDGDSTEQTSASIGPATTTDPPATTTEPPVETADKDPPATPTEPATPVETTEPAAPVETTEPAAPVETTEPAATVETTQPNTPTETTQPAETVQPATTDATPVETAQPGTPIENAAVQEAAVQELAKLYPATTVFEATTVTGGSSTRFSFVVCGMAVAFSMIQYCC